jgi:RNA:NAD 2'-phosphotransferase (TPT1/KptA family)
MVVGLEIEVKRKKIKALHPDPEKQGVNIDMEKYQVMRECILEILESHKEMGFSELMAAVDSTLTGKFEGSTGWYFTTVKLDLEARKIIERIPGSKPQRIRFIQV